MIFNHRTSSAAKGKALWMMDFEALVTAQMSVITVKIDWLSAMHLYESNYTPAEAVERYLSALRNS